MTEIPNINYDKSKPGGKILPDLYSNVSKKGGGLEKPGRLYKILKNQ